MALLRLTLTISDTLASVLKTDPDWRAVRADVPPVVRRLVRSCLEKDPRRRLQAIGDARVQIEQTLAGTPDDIDTNADGSSGPRRRATVPWVASGGLAAASIAMLLLWRPWVDAQHRRRRLCV